MRIEKEVGPVLRRPRSPSPLPAAGPVAHLKRSYRLLADFSGGFVWFSTEREQRGHHIVVPIEGFLGYVAGEPKVLARRLESAGRELIRRWREHNLPVVDGNRKALGWSEEICSFVWRDQQGASQRSCFDLLLNTYFYTRNNRYGKPSRMTLDDVKVLIKVRSTVGLNQGPDRSSLDEEGLQTDCRGYNHACSHFLGLLNSGEFADFLALATLRLLKKKRDSPSSPVGREEEEEEEEEEETPA